MDSITEDKDTLFADIFGHLSAVEAQPASALLDEDLLRRADRALDAATSRDLLWRLLGTGERLLQTLQQDPRPLTRLLERTVLLIPFDELRSSISAEKLIEGLGSPSVPIQLLCLAYLRKASDAPSGASFVACSPELVKTLITLWLSSASTEVAERSLDDIIALLAVDNPKTLTYIPSRSGGGEAEGQGLMWRRVFQDAEVYRLLFTWTSLVKSNHDLASKKGMQEVTISQARLFDFIAQVATLDWVAIITSTQASIEHEYSKDTGNANQHYDGLLRYAANGMIDPTDFLMEVLRRDFFGKLSQAVEDQSGRGVPPRLITAIQKDAGTQPQDEMLNDVNIPLR